MSCTYCREGHEYLKNCTQTKPVAYRKLLQKLNICELGEMLILRSERAITRVVQVLECSSKL